MALFYSRVPVSHDRTLKLKQLNGIQPSLTSLFTCAFPTVTCLLRRVPGLAKTEMTLCHSGQAIAQAHWSLTSHSLDVLNRLIQLTGVTPRGNPAGFRTDHFFVLSTKTKTVSLKHKWGAHDAHQVTGVLFQYYCMSLCENSDWLGCRLFKC